MPFSIHDGEFLSKKARPIYQSESVFLCLFRDKCSKKYIRAVAKINTTLSQETLQY